MCINYICFLRTSAGIGYNQVVMDKGDPMVDFASKRSRGFRDVLTKQNQDVFWSSL